MNAAYGFRPHQIMTGHQHLIAKYGAVYGAVQDSQQQPTIPHAGAAADNPMNLAIEQAFGSSRSQMQHEEMMKLRHHHHQQQQQAYHLRQQQQQQQEHHAEAKKRRLMGSAEVASNSSSTNTSATAAAAAAAAAAAYDDQAAIFDQYLSDTKEFSKRLKIVPKQTSPNSVEISIPEMETHHHSQQQQQQQQQQQPQHLLETTQLAKDQAQIEAEAMQRAKAERQRHLKYIEKMRNLKKRPLDPQQQQQQQQQQQLQTHFGPRGLMEHGKDNGGSPSGSETYHKKAAVWEEHKRQQAFAEAAATASSSNAWRERDYDWKRGRTNVGSSSPGVESENAEEKERQLHQQKLKIKELNLQATNHQQQYQANNPQQREGTQNKLENQATPKTSVAAATADTKESASAALSAAVIHDYYQQYFTRQSVTAKAMLMQQQHASSAQPQQQQQQQEQKHRGVDDRAARLTPTSLLEHKQSLSSNHKGLPPHYPTETTDNIEGGAPGVSLVEQFRIRQQQQMRLQSSTLKRKYSLDNLPPLIPIAPVLSELTNGSAANSQEQQAQQQPQATMHNRSETSSSYLNQRPRTHGERIDMGSLIAAAVSSAGTAGATETDSNNELIKNIRNTLYNPTPGAVHSQSTSAAAAQLRKDGDRPSSLSSTVRTPHSDGNDMIRIMPEAKKIAHLQNMSTSFVPVSSLSPGTYPTGSSNSNGFSAAAAASSAVITTAGASEHHSQQHSEQGRRSNDPPNYNEHEKRRHQMKQQQQLKLQQQKQLEAHHAAAMVAAATAAAAAAAVRGESLPTISPGQVRQQHHPHHHHHTKGQLDNLPGRKPPQQQQQQQGGASLRVNNPALFEHHAAGAGSQVNNSKDLPQRIRSSSSSSNNPQQKSISPMVAHKPSHMYLEPGEIVRNRSGARLDIDPRFQYAMDMNQWKKTLEHQAQDLIQRAPPGSSGGGPNPTPIGSSPIALAMANAVGVGNNNVAAAGLKGGDGAYYPPKLLSATANQQRFSPTGAMRTSSSPTLGSEHLTTKDTTALLRSFRKEELLAQARKMGASVPASEVRPALPTTANTALAQGTKDLKQQQQQKLQEQQKQQQQQQQQPPPPPLSSPKQRGATPHKLSTPSPRATSATPPVQSPKKTESPQKKRLPSGTPVKLPPPPLTSVPSTGHHDTDFQPPSSVAAAPTSSTSSPPSRKSPPSPSSRVPQKSHISSAVRQAALNAMRSSIDLSGSATKTSVPATTSPRLGGGPKLSNGSTVVAAAASPHRPTATSRTSC